MRDAPVPGNGPPAGAARISRREANFAFALLFLLYTFDYVDRLVIVSLFPFLQREWGLTDAQCGLLVSAVYGSILLCTFPLSVLVDRWSRKNSIGIMALLWSLATVSCAFARNFGQLFAARAAVGVGEAGYAPGGTAMISALFPKERRAVMMGIWNASIPLGSALGIALGGVIAEHLGWRHAFGIVALPGALVALLMFRVRDYQTVALVRANPTGAGRAARTYTRMGPREVAWHFAGNRTLVLNNLAFAANTFVTTSLLTWLPTYFHRVDGIPMSQAGPKGGLVMLLAIVGAPLGGFWADRWYRTRSTARLLFPALSSLTTALILGVAFHLLHGPAQYAVLLLAGIAAVSFVSAGVAVTQDVVHPGLRAVSLSLNVIIQHLLGSSLGPTFVGAVSDRYDLPTALGCLPVFAALAGVLFFLASFSYDRDLARAEGAGVEVAFEGDAAA